MKKMRWEDVEKTIYSDHNHSWIEDIYQRNKNNLDKVAIAFRKNNITYSEYFKYVVQYAKALAANGVKKGDEVVVCLRQTPDYPILFGAVSLLGAKINLTNPGFNKDFLVNIINEANSKVFLVSDWDFCDIKESLHKLNNDKKIISLSTKKWDKYNNPFKEITDQFYKFDEKAYLEATNEFDKIFTTDEFLEMGKNYKGEINGHAGLDDTVSICYTSGSTKPGIHKAVPIKNKTYIILGRYYDHEVYGLPKANNLRTFSSIGTQADTTLLSGLSSSFMQGGTYIVDPIIDPHYFPYSLKLNDVKMGIATRSYWLTAMKDTYYNENLNDLKLPYLYAPIEGGEPLSAGEEKALNKWLNKVKAGTDLTHTPMSVIKMSIGGGDTENGNIFVKLYRAYNSPLQKIRGINEPIGLEYYNFAEVEVLKDDGTYCKPMELGRLVASSPMTMEGYYKNVDANKDFFITDAYGKKWGSLNNYGYKDSWGNVYYKGRIKNNNSEIKNFQIADVIARDTKNIMSCEVIYLDGYYIAHIEPQFNKKVNVRKMLLSAEQRCYSIFGDSIRNKLLFRVRTNVEGFPVNNITKRDISKLESEGITEKCIVPSEEYIENDVVKLKKKL